MGSPNDAAVTKLKQDVDSKHLDKFIADLQTDLKGMSDPNQQKQLKQDAQKILVDAKLIPSVDIIDGVSNGHLDIKDNNQKALTLDQTGNLRDDQNHLLHANAGSHEGNTYGYDAQSGELNSVSWKDSTGAAKSFQKKADGWYDENGQKFDNGKEPKLDQNTGDLTYTRTGAATETTEKANGSRVEKATDGSAVTYNPDGQVDSVVDKNHNSRTVTARDPDGKPTAVEYKEPGGFTDHWEKQPDNTWKNKENPQRTAKDIGFNDNGDYYQTDNTGTKETFHPNGKRTSATPWQQARDDYRGKLPDALKDKDSVKIDHGATIWDIAKENLKKNSSDHHDPSNTEVANETNRLIKKYNDDPKHTVKINKAGTNVPIGTEINTAIDAKTGNDHQNISYDGNGSKAANVKDVSFQNGNTTHIEHNTDGTVKSMHIKAGDKTYDVTNDNGKYTAKDEKGGTAEVEAPTVDPDTGAVTLKRKDGSGTIQINSDGTDTIASTGKPSIHYDGKGHADKDVTDIDYPNKEHVHFDRKADGSVNTANIKGPDGQVKYQLAPKDGGKYALLDGDGNDLHTEISNIKTDPNTGAVELDGTKDNKPYKLNIDAKGAETVSDQAAPPVPPPQTKAHTEQIASGPSVTYEADGNDPNHATDLKYGDKAKAHFDRNTDGSIKSGTLSFDGHNYKLVTEGDHLALHEINANGPETDTGFTFKSADVKLDPNTGELVIKGTQQGTDRDIDIKPDGSASS
jgi:hypothetical protein